jgi:hypothetical protein
MQHGLAIRTLTVELLICCCFLRVQGGYYYYENHTNFQEYSKAEQKEWNKNAKALKDNEKKS